VFIALVVIGAASWWGFRVYEADQERQRTQSLIESANSNAAKVSDGRVPVPCNPNRETDAAYATWNIVYVHFEEPREGGDVFLDGSCEISAVGRREVYYRVPPGTYEIRVKRKSAPEFTEQVTVTATRQKVGVNVVSSRDRK